MKRIQNFYLFSYRLTGFIFLTGLIASIVWYGFSLMFFIGSSSWSVPMILSPNQEKVINHMEHLLNIEQQLTKNIVELKAAKKALKEKKIILFATKALNVRMADSIVSQADLYARNSKKLDKFTAEKAENLSKLSQLASEITQKEATIATELKLGLITKQEALSQEITLSNLRNNIVDSKTKVHELGEQSKHYADAAKTLNGTANDLLAIHKVIKKAELDRQISELKIDTYSLAATIKALQISIQKRKNALEVMEKSPYIAATKGLTTVAFVPYRNLKNAIIGSPVYSCYLDMILCYKAGTITQIYKAEEYGVHPIFKSETKGQLVGVTFFNEKDAQKKLLFLHSKPLLI